MQAELLRDKEGRPSTGAAPPATVMPGSNSISMTSFANAMFDKHLGSILLALRLRLMIIDHNSSPTYRASPAAFHQSLSNLLRMYNEAITVAQNCTIMDANNEHASLCRSVLVNGIAKKKSTTNIRGGSTSTTSTTEYVVLFLLPRLLTHVAITNKQSMSIVEEIVQATVILPVPENQMIGFFLCDKPSTGLPSYYPDHGGGEGGYDYRDLCHRVACQLLRVSLIQSFATNSEAPLPLYQRNKWPDKLRTIEEFLSFRADAHSQIQMDASCALAFWKNAKSPMLVLHNISYRDINPVEKAARFVQEHSHLQRRHLIELVTDNCIRDLSSLSTGRISQRHCALAWKHFAYTYYGDSTVNDHKNNPPLRTTAAVCPTIKDVELIQLRVTLDLANQLNSMMGPEDLTLDQLVLDKQSFLMEDTSIWKRSGCRADHPERIGSSAATSHVLRQSCGEIVANVTTIEGAFSHRMRKLLFLAMDGSEFALGVGGRSGSFVRIVTDMTGLPSTSQPPPFLLGKRTLFPSVRMADGKCWERDIMDMMNLVVTQIDIMTMNELVGRYGAKTVERLKEGRHVLFSKVNQLQVLIHPLNDGYASHSDDSPLLNCLDPENPDEDFEVNSLGECLPTVKTMSVVTFVFLVTAEDLINMKGNFINDPTNLAHKSNDNHSSRCWHEVKWYSNSSNDNQPALSLPTYDSFVHVQCPGTQQYFKHKVDYVGDKCRNQGNREKVLCRVVISGRVCGFNWKGLSDSPSMQNDFYKERAGLGSMSGTKIIQRTSYQFRNVISQYVEGGVSNKGTGGLYDSSTATSSPADRYPKAYRFLRQRVAETGKSTHGVAETGKSTHAVLEDDEEGNSITGENCHHNEHLTKNVTLGVITTGPADTGGSSGGAEGGSTCHNMHQEEQPQTPKDSTICIADEGNAGLLAQLAVHKKFTHHKMRFTSRTAWLSYKVYRPPPMIGCAQPTWEKMTSSPAVVMMLKNHRVLLQTHHHDSKSLFFCTDALALTPAGLLFQPLQSFNRLAMAPLLNVPPQKHRAQPVVNRDHRKSNTLILTQRYKNDDKSIVKAIEILLDNILHGYHEESIAEDCINTTITIYGSGGAPSTMEEYAPDITKQTKSQPAFLESTNQKAESPVNSCLTALNQRDAPVAVFVDIDHFKIDEQLSIALEEVSASNGGDMGTMMFFLGYYGFKTVTVRPTNLEVLIEEAGPGDDDEYFRFRECKCQAYTLEPLFSSADWKNVIIPNNNLWGDWDRWKLLNSHKKEEETLQSAVICNKNYVPPLCVPIPKSIKAVNAMKLRPESLPTNFVLQTVCAAGSMLWRKYCTPLTADSGYDDDKSPCINKKSSIAHYNGSHPRPRKKLKSRHHYNRLDARRLPTAATRLTLGRFEGKLGSVAEYNTKANVATDAAAVEGVARRRLATGELSFSDDDSSTTNCDGSDPVFDYSPNLKDNNDDFDLLDDKEEAGDEEAGDGDGDEDEDIVEKCLLAIGDRILFPTIHDMLQTTAIAQVATSMRIVEMNLSSEQLSGEGVRGCFPERSLEQGGGFYSNREKYSQFFWTPLEHAPLGSLVRGQSFPSSNRCYDAPVLTLIGEATTTHSLFGVLPPLFRKNEPSTHAVLLPDYKVLSPGKRADIRSLLSGTEGAQQKQIATELLFVAIIMRLTGLVQSFEEYSMCRHRPSTEAAAAAPESSAQFAFPSRQNIEEFILFLNNKRNLPQGKTCFSSVWISPQHQRSIPDVLRKNVRGMCNMIKNVANEVGGLFNQLFPMESFQDTTSPTIVTLQNREQCCETFAGWLKKMLIMSCGQSFAKMGKQEEKKLSFLAGLVMADYEEVFDSPFGDVTLESINCGFGSEAGIALMNASISIWIETGAEQQGYYGLPAKRDNASILSMVYEQFRDRAMRDETFRDIMGWTLVPTELAGEASTRLVAPTRENGQGTLVVALNGRPVNYVDAEAILCKLYVVLSRNLGRRSTTEQPLASRADCHPIPLYLDQKPWDEDVLWLLNGKGIISYWSSQQVYFDKVPWPLLMSNEPSQVLKKCDGADDDRILDDCTGVGSLPIYMRALRCYIDSVLDRWNSNISIDV